MSYDPYLLAQTSNSRYQLLVENVITKYTASYSQIHYIHLSIWHRTITKYVNILANARHTLLQEQLEVATRYPRISQQFAYGTRLRRTQPAQNPEIVVTCLC
jgi:hypothetical protein